MKSRAAMITQFVTIIVVNRSISCGSCFLVQSDNSFRKPLKFPYNPQIIIACIMSKAIANPAQIYFVKLFMFLKYYLQKYKKYHCLAFY